MAKHAPQSVVDQDLWLYDLTRRANPTRQTSAPSLEFWPLWVTNDRFVYGLGGGDAGASSSAPPRKLFNVPGVLREWGVTKDGSRFLFAVPVGPPPPLTIVRDWQAGLPK